MHRIGVTDQHVEVISHYDLVVMGNPECLLFGAEMVFEDTMQIWQDPTTDAIIYSGPPKQFSEYQDDWSMLL